MLEICIVFLKSEPQYAYKRYAYKKHVCFEYLNFSILTRSFFNGYQVIIIDFIDRRSF